MSDNCIGSLALNFVVRETTVSRWCRRYSLGESMIAVGLPPLRTLKAASVGRRSGFCRSGTASPSVGIVVLLLFPFDRERSLTTPFSRRESSRQVAFGTSFWKVERGYEDVNGVCGGQFFDVVECSIFYAFYPDLLALFLCRPASVHCYVLGFHKIRYAGCWHMLSRLTFHGQIRVSSSARWMDVTGISSFFSFPNACSDRRASKPVIMIELVLKWRADLTGGNTHYRTVVKLGILDIHKVICWSGSTVQIISDGRRWAFEEADLPFERCMRSESDGRLTNRSEGKGLNVLPCRAPRYDDTWQLAPILSYTWGSRRQIWRKRTGMDWSWFLHFTLCLLCFAGGSGLPFAFVSRPEIQTARRQYWSREGLSFMPSHFQDSPRFAKNCQYSPRFANICQDLPIFAKAVAPTGVSGVKEYLSSPLITSKQVRGIMSLTT